MHCKIREDCGCEDRRFHHDTVCDIVDYSMISVQFVEEGLAKYQERN